MSTLVLFVMGSNEFMAFYIPKSKLDRSVDLSLCGLALAQSQMDLFLDAL